jgi:hypothetical protein
LWKWRGNDVCNGCVAHAFIVNETIFYSTCNSQTQLLEDLYEEPYSKALQIVQDTQKKVDTIMRKQYKKNKLKELVEFAPDCVATMEGQELVAVWLHPQSLPELKKRPWIETY